MSAETKRVLELLTEGKISSADAEKLLDKLSGSSTNHAGSPPGDGAASATNATSHFGGPRKFRFLRIVVERPGHDHINLRVPLSLARTSSLMALVPPRVCERLAEQGIDLKAFAAMREEELEEALGSANIEINKGNGKKVRVFCE